MYKITVNGFLTRIVNKKTIKSFLASGNKKKYLEIWFPNIIINEYLISSNDSLDGIRGNFI